MGTTRGFHTLAVSQGLRVCGPYSLIAFCAETGVGAV